MRPWSLYTPPVATTDELFSEIFGGKLCDASCIAVAIAKVDQTWWFGGSKSRNKVSVGEPAEGSLKKFNNFENGFFFFVLARAWELLLGKKTRDGESSRACA